MLNYFFRLNGEKNSYGVYLGLYERKVFDRVRFREGIICEDILFTYDVYKNANKIGFSNQIKYYLSQKHYF